MDRRQLLAGAACALAAAACPVALSLPEEPLVEPLVTGVYVPPHEPGRVWEVWNHGSQPLRVLGLQRGDISVGPGERAVIECGEDGWQWVETWLPLGEDA